MFESDAHNKLCPFIQAAPSKNINCITKNCMAWEEFDTNKGYCKMFETRFYLPLQKE